MTRAATTCERVRERITAYREGWLSDGERADVDQHLAACAGCAAEMRRDEALIHALASARPAPQVAPAWADVLAKRRRAGIPGTRARGRSLVWAGAAAIVLTAALLLPRPASQRGGIPPTAPLPSASGMAGATAPIQAHALLAVGSVGGDPNRAMLLACTSGGEGVAR